jgi:hypothetical protein
MRGQPSPWEIKSLVEQAKEASVVREAQSAVSPAGRPACLPELHINGYL